MRKAKAGSKHSWNSCGSEARKGERKHTGLLSTGTGKECTGNQAGKNGEDRGSESELGALRKPLRGGDRKKREKKKQRLSSQNPKLKRTKESENSGGQKVNGKKRKRKEVEPREARKRKPESKGEPEEAAAEIEAGGRRKEIADEAIR